ncbi:PLAC8-domain-containing protein [Meredithblackwellia eburnea MCA 4105]
MYGCSSANLSIPRSCAILNSFRGARLSLCVSYHIPRSSLLLLPSQSSLATKAPPTNSNSNNNNNNNTMSDPAPFVSSQPSAEKSMNMQVTPGAAPPVGEDGKRDFRFGVFDCFEDMSSCLIGWCLPCVMYGQSEERFNSVKDGRANPNAGSGIGGDCCLFLCASYCMLGGLLVYFQRDKIQKQFGIRSEATDIVWSCCCPCCANIQQYKELEAIEQGIQGGNQV